MRTFLTLAALAALSHAMVDHEALSATPLSMGWRDNGVVPDETIIEFTVAVSQNTAGVAELNARLLDMSDPASPRFSQHMTNEDIHSLVAPAPAAIVSVVDWLTAVAGDAPLRHSLNSDFITVDLPVRTAESLINAEYHNYTHVTSGMSIVRTTSYQLPADLVAHVDFVSPAIRFPHVFQTRITSQSLRGANAVSPSSLRQLLKTGNAAGKSPDNLQAAMGFLSQFISPSDVQTFFKDYDSVESGKTFTITGPNTESNPGIEASLDVEYIMSIGANVPTIFWSKAGQQPGNPQNEPFLAWLTDVAALPDNKVPKVFSVSYGDNEPGVDFSYAQRVNVEFQKLGARGVSIMFSSGDGGVGGGQPSSCTTFIPTFPAGSPYVTAVGGTNGDGSSAAGLSSGGFANYFDRPDFQKSAVEQYFKVATNLPDSALYNHTGAGIPDVAAPAEGFVIVWQGFSTTVAGTSCAAPTFSGVVSLVNDLRLQNGKAPLGYLNPMIYSNPNLFQDITTGNNPGCNTPGFFAAAGWDPVTGYGLPDYEKWSQFALSLP